jgi:hypothetical protein
MSGNILASNETSSRNCNSIYREWKRKHNRDKVKVKVKQSPYRPGETQRVPGG